MIRSRSCCTLQAIKMDWDTDINKDGSWRRVLDYIYIEMHRKYNGFRMYDPILVDHVESNFYEESDKDILEVVRLWGNVVVTRYLDEISKPSDSHEIIMVAYYRRIAAEELYECKRDYLEGLFKVRELYQEPDNDIVEIEDEEPICKVESDILELEIEMFKLQCVALEKDVMIATRANVLDGLGTNEIEKEDLICQVDIDSSEVELQIIKSKSVAVEEDLVPATKVDVLDGFGQFSPNIMDTKDDDGKSLKEMLIGKSLIIGYLAYFGTVYVSKKVDYQQCISKNSYTRYVFDRGKLVILYKFK